MAVGITVVVLIIVAILYAVLCTRYRERWCAREGFEDLGKVSDEWYQRLRVHQHCFGEGDVGHVGSCLRKVIDGRTLWLLEHEWRTGSINDRRAVWKTFVIWELDEPGLPHFTLSQRTPPVVQTLATVIRAILFIPYLLFLRPHKAPPLRGFAPAEDNCDYSEEFARRYQVTGDPDATRKLLTRDVQACFCEKPFSVSDDMTNRRKWLTSLRAVSAGGLAAGSFGLRFKAAFGVDDANNPAALVTRQELPSVIRHGITATRPATLLL